MKLIRFGEPGAEKPGVILDGKRRDASSLVADYDEDFFGHQDLQEFENKVLAADLPEVGEEVRWASPVARPGKLVCIGLNYADHAAESGMDLPEEPVIFFKATSAIVGPYDRVIIPKRSVKTEWEVELGIVIGKKASYLSYEDEMDHVAGYVVHNDVREREFQKESGGQWVKGRSYDTYDPIGCWIATEDEIKKIDGLKPWINVNEEKLQDGTTA